MVSQMCLGCGNYGWRVKEDESIKLVSRALDSGINFFDTANFYGDGNSERFLGKALKLKGARDKAIIVTKVHGIVDKNDPNGRGISRRHIIQQCEASLKRLDTDWIDFYIFHRPMPQIPIDESLRAMDDLVRSGKIRYIGFSTFAAWQTVESLWVSKELGLNRVVCEQPPYNLLDRSIERELLPMAQTYGLGVITWSPLAYGLLSGKYTRETVDFDTHLALLGNDAKKKLDEAFVVIEKLRALAKQKQCTMGNLSLAWLLHQEAITCPLIGCRTMEQMEDNLHAASIALTPEELNAIDEIVAPGSQTIPYYAADFGPHPYRW
jgi:aryl-alcohol dehydrogenase-like predicted oxidoreductase